MTAAAEGQWESYRGVMPWARRYAALIRTAWLVDLQYRATIAIWMLWGILEPIIALGIWWSIAGRGTISGYGQDDFARYFFAITLVGQFTVAWDAWYIDRWIRHGELNYRLARPLAPVHEAIADNIAYKARTASIVVLMWVAAAIVWPVVRLPLHPGRWALAAVAVVLAAGIRFFNGYATGLLAFWTTRATALVELQFGVSLFLSGRIAPLSLLPLGVQRVANVLWFPWMLAFPVDLLTGAVTTRSAIVHGFVLQMIWLGAWWGAYRIVWWRGLRRYGAVGG
jgi:ABC-2 type transport system permease protein